jgi:hypothetical protein
MPGPSVRKTAQVLLTLLVSSLAIAQSEKPKSTVLIGGDVYELYYKLTTGSGKYDHIGVHRVIQMKNGKPIVSKDAILLTHGDVWNFDQAFMGGISKDSIPYFLASQGVDVWGIDLAWTLVPKSENNFAFMKTWGMGHDINDMETALTFARKVRQETGSDGGRLHLLAWSRGGWLGYGLLDQESQLSCDQRQVKGYIPVDTYYKTDYPDSKTFACNAEAEVDRQIASGVYASNGGISNAKVGQVAIADPYGKQVDYNNLQYSMIEGAAFYDYGFAFAPEFHYTGGTFAAKDKDYFLPTGLKYTTIARWNGFLIGGSPYEANQMQADAASVTCGDDSNLPFDKHLADITVPIHYVAAGGGFSKYGLYTLSLLGSTDQSHNIVSLYPADKQKLDFGHLDLFYAENAPKLVWSDILSWLKNHESDNSCMRK